MARKDEISSTEKLLDLIRGDPAPASADNETASAPPSGKSWLFNALAFQKAMGIGVEIGNHYIKIAKINRLSDKSFELVDYDTISVDRIETLDTPRLAKALAAVLVRFCKGLKHYDIWCCVASARVETRCIRIPKLPRKQIPNAVFWTFSKEVSFSDKEMMLDFRILGDVIENGMAKTRVMTFTVPIAETEALKRLFTRTGFPLTGISIVPFAIQNLLKTRVVQQTGQNTCCLFIGRDWSRITIYADGDLILSRGIKAGMHSMIEAIACQYRHPSQNDTPPAMVIKDRGGEIADERDADFAAAREDFFRFLVADGAADKTLGPDGGKTYGIFRTILPAIDRLVKQVERTIGHFSMHFKSSGVSEILISGKVTANPKIISHIGSRLGVPVHVLNPFPRMHPFTKRVTAPDLPEERESFVPAVGIGLSSNALTPNFLFTYRHREKRDRARQIRIGLSAASIAFLALLLCGFFWQENRIAAKAVEVNRLIRERDAFNVPLTRNLVMALYARANKKRAIISTLDRRYYSSAVMAEVCHLTPDNIQLIALDADMGALSKDSKNRSKPAMVIEGIVTGNQIRFETDLAGYMLTMEASPLFTTPVVKNKRLQFLDDRPVLRFSIQFTLA